MHTDTLRHPAHPGSARRRPTVGGRLLVWANRLLERERQRAREKRTVHALRQLSDATLKDIGIDRSEILSVAAGHHDRRRPGDKVEKRQVGAPLNGAGYSRETSETDQTEKYFRASLAGLALVLALVLALLASGVAMAAGCDRFWSERGAAEGPPKAKGTTG